MIKYMCRDAGLNKVEVLNLYQRIPLSFWHTKVTRDGHVQNLFNDRLILLPLERTLVSLAL